VPAPDVFVAKVSPVGKFLWGASAGGTGSDTGNSLALDSVGNSVFTGSFAGTATFGTKSLTAGGTRDIFIAKVNPNGQI